MAIDQFYQFELIPSWVFEQIVSIDQSVMDFPWKKEQWENYLQKELNWMVVIFSSEEFVQGFVLYQLSQDKWSHLLKIGVSDDFKRQGIAKGLMERSLSRLKISFDSCSLEVREENLFAISLYQKFHFKKVHRMNNYYSDGSSAIKMIAALR